MATYLKLVTPDHKAKEVVKIIGYGLGSETGRGAQTAFDITEVDAPGPEARVRGFTPTQPRKKVSFPLRFTNMQLNI
jgi:hypothetical protein